MYYDYNDLYDEALHEYYNWSPLYHAIDAGKFKLKLKLLCVNMNILTQNLNPTPQSRQ